MAPIALLLPGQGAQTVGMGEDIVAEFPPARELFRTAGDVLGFDLRALCMEGPLEELSASHNAQPAILTLSIATLRALQQAAGTTPEVAGAAGLSLGEWSALVAAEALPFREALQLVRRRGRYMQEACEANPGTMYSVLGMPDQQVENACKRVRKEEGGRVWPANYNCPGQLVISGETEAAAAVVRICEEEGARRVIQLNVAGPFHTPLMKPAADRLATDLESAPITTPQCPIMANAAGAPVREPEEIRRLLLLQITSPVRWAEDMRRLIEGGARTFFEVGPGKVLRGLLRRIDRKLSCHSVNTAQDVRRCARIWQEGA